MTYFLSRTLIRKLLDPNKKQKEFDAIFLTNYDRYYGNERFFGKHLFNDNDFINLTKNLASYLGKYNIKVNSISPGGVFDNQPESFAKKYSEKVVLEKRMENTLKYLSFLKN